MGRLEKQIIASALALVGILLSVVIINGLEPNPGSQPAKVLTQYPDAVPALAIAEASGPTDSQKPEVTAKIIEFPPSTVVSHRVALGDSIWSIAQSQLGSRNAYNEILKLNPGLDGRPLIQGEKIWLPKLSTTPAVAADSVPAPATEPKGPHTHLIVSGDSLWKLSKMYYGSDHPKDMQRIVDANRELQADLQEPYTVVQNKKEVEKIAKHRVLETVGDVLRLNTLVVIPE